MPVLKLTDLTIERLPPSDPPELYTDASLPGFGVRVGKRSKTFVAVVGSRERRKVSLGKYPAMSLKAARVAASDLINGTSVVPLSISFLDAFTTYQGVYVASSYRPRAAKEVGRLVGKHCQSLHASKIAAVTPVALVAIFDSLRSTPSEANHLFGVLRTFFSWCEARDYIARSPLAKLSRPYRETSRSRLLTDAEVAKIYSTATVRDDVFARIVLISLLSGQRRGEISQMQRSWIDTARRVFVIPADVAKNGIEHTVPYTDTMAAIFDRCGAPFLFPARRTQHSFSGFGECKADFDKVCGVQDFTLHDLRRYFSSTHARLGTPIDITEAILNHVSGSRSAIQRIYDRHDRTEQCRSAMNAFDAHIRTLLNETTTILKTP